MSDDIPEVIDMPAAPASFEDRGGWLVRQLVAEFEISPIAAAGIVGNLGFESVGFTTLQEIGQIAPRGGYGWAQWTGPRRRQYEAYCKRTNLNPASDQANYNFLCAELAGPYNQMLSDLDEVTNLGEAVMIVGKSYERPGGTTANHLPGFNHRLIYAERALKGSGL